MKNENEISPVRLLLLHVIELETEYRKSFADDLEDVDVLDEDELYDYIKEHEVMGFLEDIRCSGTETNLEPKQYSRNYEVDFVSEIISGRCIGWSYYYGGGKHGYPEDCDWLQTAEYLDYTEYEVTVIKRTFSRR
jgi:hypothetical protein